jgi:hypothetical protein
MYESKQSLLSLSTNKGTQLIVTLQFGSSFAVWQWKFLSEVINKFANFITAYENDMLLDIIIIMVSI